MKWGFVRRRRTNMKFAISAINNREQTTQKTINSVDKTTRSHQLQIPFCSSLPYPCAKNSTSFHNPTTHPLRPPLPSLHLRSAKLLFIKVDKLVDFLPTFDGLSRLKLKARPSKNAQVIGTTW